MSKTIGYKAKLDDGDIMELSLATMKGKVGYRISKFQVMPFDPTTDNMEATIKIYKKKQATATNTIDFGDSTILAAAYIENHDGTSAGFSNFTNAVVFDHETFNQNIYITLQAGSGAGTSGVNFYIELEKLDLSDIEATYHTLQSIRTLSE
jgi:hypothetical protein